MRNPEIQVQGAGRTAGAGRGGAGGTAGAGPQWVEGRVGSRGEPKASLRRHLRAVERHAGVHQVTEWAKGATPTPCKTKWTQLRPRALGN